VFFDGTSLASTRSSCKLDRLNLRSSERRGVGDKVKIARCAAAAIAAAAAAAAAAPLRCCESESRCDVGGLRQRGAEETQWRSGY
jgi:hypothetical protein